MERKTIADRLWGNQGKVGYLLLAAAVLLLTMLGSRDIWTQEHRWADIVSGMFYRHDFLHPYLGDVDYYDKPLMSYWLIAAVSWLTGHVSTWSLRLPSVLAGLISIGSLYSIGVTLKDKRLGLLSGWMLLTTFYFIFWARTSSADMLNLGGTLLAVARYFDRKSRPGFFTYAVFFLILALTSLCKGLIGAIVPLIVIFPDLVMRSEWKNHIRISFVLAMVPAALVYISPFVASSYIGGDGYGESGLYLVYRENILRYFQPFDHKGPIYTYFVYLPIYLLPWTFFFIPALFGLKGRWQQLSTNTKSICWAVLLVFAFLTCSGSRRNYYVLPLVPFTILMTADWILAQADQARRNVLAGKVAISFFVLLFLAFDVVQPLYYAGGGYPQFAQTLKTEVAIQKPWSEWRVVLLDPESKVSFYLGLPPTTKNYAIAGGERGEFSQQMVEQAWPMLRNKNAGTIFLTRKLYEPLLRDRLPSYRVVSAQPTWGERLLHIDNRNAPVAFIP